MNLSEILLTSPVVQTVGWALLHSLWQELILAGILSGTLGLRKSTANTRYIIACAALLLMLILPLCTSLRSKRQMQNLKSESAIAQNLIPVESTAFSANNSKLSDNVQLAAYSQSLIGQTEKQFNFLLPWLAFTWLLGVSAASIRLFGVWTYTQQLKRNEKRVFLEQWQDNLQRLTRQLCVTKPVLLLESSLVKVPTVIGWLRPLILVPPSALIGSTPPQLESIIVHELAHIRRHDYLINLFQTIIETLLFYHPAVWWVSKQIRVERENACDDLAVTVSGDALGYARALTKMARLRKNAATPSLAMAAAVGSDSLTARIHRLVGVEPQRSTGLAGLWTAIFISTFIIVVGVNAQLPLLGNSVSLDATPENIRKDYSKLIEKLESTNPTERATAICSLGKKGDVSVIPILIRKLDDEEPISAPLGCWNSGDWSPLLETFKQPSPGEEAAIALASMGKNAVEPLVISLNGTNPSVRRNAAWAIGEIRDGDKVDRATGALAPLINALKDEDPWVRRAAAFAFSEIKDARAATALINALSDGNAGVRETAANALGEMKESSAVVALQIALKDRNKSVRKMAQWSLIEIQDR